jgi:hypothetical protein
MIKRIGAENVRELNLEGVDVRVVRYRYVWFFLLLSLSLATNSYARDLVDQFNTLFGPRGLVLRPPTDPRFISHVAHFSSASAATFGLLTQQLAPSAADFPAISTTPGFTFRYDPQLQVFQRSSGSLGPIYVERPQTVGQGKLDIGISYLNVDFDRLNGKNLEGLRFRLQHGDCCQPRENPPDPGDPFFERDSIGVTYEKFSLRSHVVSLSATYGLTDNWDVNILLPIVFTSLNLRARAVIDDVGSQSQGLGGRIHVFPSGSQVQVQSANDNKTGVGDIQLRTKYHLPEFMGFNLGTGLALRLPSGSQGNFQGLGDVTLTPFITVAREYGPFDLHASSGLQINFDDSDRSRIRYAGGITFRLIEEIALLVDIVGSSNLQSDRISRKVTETLSDQQGNLPPVDTEVTQIASRSLHTDVIDLNVGFKISPFGTKRSIVGFGTVFVPLNNDGLRADAIPAVGLEFGF